MKKIAITIGLLFALLLCPALWAQTRTVNFEWDPHPQASEIAGFYLFEAKSSMTYGSTPETAFSPGTATTGSVLVSEIGLGRHYFALTAFLSDGTQSSYSNEVTLVIRPDPPVLKSVVQSVASAPIRVLTKLAGLFKPHQNLRIVN